MKDDKRLEKAMAVNNAYKRTFATDEGQIVLEDLMLATGVISGSSFAPGDPYQTAFNEGRREVVNRIIESINIDPNKFMKIVDSIKDQGDYDDEINF